jgi:prevent-host-death family protein
MIRASITEAKNQLSKYLDAVRRGESVLILDRNKPIARIEPAGSAADIDSWQSHLQKLEREGRVARAKKKLPIKFFDEPRPCSKHGKALAEAVRLEREEGR